MTEGAEFTTCLETLKEEGYRETPPRRGMAPKGVIVTRNGHSLAELSPQPNPHP